jgi:hypothetical protein
MECNNPCFLIVSLAGSDGKVAANWRVEFGPRTTLFRSAWKPDSRPVRIEISINGDRAKDVR